MVVRWHRMTSTWPNFYGCITFWCRINCYGLNIRYCNLYISQGNTINYLNLRNKIAWNWFNFRPVLLPQTQYYFWAHHTHQIEMQPSRCKIYFEIALISGVWKRSNFLTSQVHCLIILLPFINPVGFKWSSNHKSIWKKISLVRFIQK